MDVASLKTALKRYAGMDDSDPLLMWLNAAYHEFEDAWDWPFLAADTLMTATVGSSSLVPTPTDFFKANLMMLGPPGTTDRSACTEYVEWKSMAEFTQEWQDSTDSGKPVYWSIVDGLIVMWPTPDQAYALALYYQKQFSDLVNNSDVPLLPTRYHFGLVYGAAAIALQSESEEERAQSARAEFENYMSRAISKYTYPQLGKADTVRDTAGYGD